jgi:hypothetical protein
MQVLCISDTNIISSKLIQFCVSFAFISLASVLVIKLKISIWFFFCQRNGKTRITKPKLHFVISEWSTNNDPFQHSWFDLSKPDAAYYCCPSYTTEDINVNIWYIRVINNLLIKLLHCMTGLIHYHMTNDHTRRNFGWFRTFIIPRPYYDSSHRNYFRKSSMKEVLK